MIHQQASYQHRTPQELAQSMAWLLQMLNQYWFHLFLIGMILHLYWNKDISIQVKVADKDPQALEQTSWLGNGEGQALLSSLVPFERTTASTRKANPADQYSNLAFILNPQLEEKRQVAPSIVQEKLEINRQYVERFAKVAISEMKKFQVPASIILAQGLLQSDAGASVASQKGHNHFRIPCDANCAECGCATIRVNGGEEAMRTFATDWESYREHSLMLGMGDFDDLINHKSAYAEWAERIERLWYPADTQYAKKLIRIIEVLDLYYFDRV